MNEDALVLRRFIVAHVNNEFSHESTLLLKTK